MNPARRIVLVVSALAAAAAVGCGTNPQPTTVVCSEYTVGADLSQTDFGVTGAAARPFTALAQASSDVALVSASMLGGLRDACESLVLDFGGTLPEQAPGATFSEQVKASCDAAKASIAAAQPKLFAAKFRMVVTPARCTIDVDYQTACEARCQASPTCVDATPTARCATAELASVCAGTCKGTCSERHGDDDKSPVCDGVCVGECDGAARNATCGAPLAPPTCPGDVDCQAACKASGAARAACDGGSLDITPLAGKEGDVATAQLLSSLRRNLPPIFLSSKGRGQLIADDASSLIDAAGHLLLKLQSVGQHGASCGLLIANTGSEASTNMKAVVSGSKVVASAVEALSPPR